MLMKTHTHIWFAALILILSVSAHAVTLQEYAQQHPLTIYTAAKGANVPLGDDPTNNIDESDKLLLLDGKGITSIDGISTLMADDDGHKVQLAKVDKLLIFMNGNDIETLPAEIGQMKRVIFIYFEKNQLSALPPEIAQMSSLQGMYFTRNHFTEIPAVVFTMKWLRKLQFSQNHIKVMPPEIGNLTNLIHMDMSDNEFESLPDSISHLQQLRVCSLSDNHLTSLPESFGSVKIRYQLRVRDNPLTTLPAGFADMPGSIDITGTKIDVNTLSPAIRAKLDTKTHKSDPHSSRPFPNKS